MGTLKSHNAVTTDEHDENLNAKRVVIVNDSKIPDIDLIIIKCLKDIINNQKVSVKFPVWFTVCTVVSSISLFSIMLKTLIH